MGFSLSQGPWTYNRFDLYEKKAKPDYLDFDKDGDKKESMKKALKEKGKKSGDCGCNKVPCNCDKKEVKEDVVQIDEISSKLALTASQKADEERRKASIAGDRDRAASKAAQASRLYKGVGPRRTKERMKEEFLVIAQELVSEGYDLSDYTWDELYTIYESNLETAPIEMAEAEDVFQRMTDSGIFSEEEINAIREGWKPLPREKMDRQAGKAYGKEQQAVAKGDEAGANKQMQRRIAMQMPQGRKQQLIRKNSPINKLSERG